MDHHTPHHDATMEVAVPVDERGSSPPAAAARSRHMRTLMQSLTDSESSPAAATRTAATSPGAAEQTDAAPVPACWFTAPSATKTAGQAEWEPLVKLSTADQPSDAAPLSALLSHALHLSR